MYRACARPLDSRPRCPGVQFHRPAAGRIPRARRCGGTPLRRQRFRYRTVIETSSFRDPRFRQGPAARLEVLPMQLRATPMRVDCTAIHGSRNASNDRVFPPPDCGVAHAASCGLVQCQTNALCGAAPISAITLVAIDADTRRLIGWLSIPGFSMSDFTTLRQSCLES